MEHENETTSPAPVGQVERGVGRLEPERDLVERLREGSANWALDETMQEAAAEIERLRSAQSDALTQTMLMWNAAWMALPESVRGRCWPDENPLASGIRLLLAREVTPNVRANLPALGGSACARG